MSPGTEKLLERAKSWPEEDQEELAEFARELNHGAVAFIGYRTRNEPRYGREWMPRAVAILRPTRR